MERLVSLRDTSAPQKNAGDLGAGVGGAQSDVRGKLNSCFFWGCRLDEKAQCYAVTLPLGADARLPLVIQMRWICVSAHVPSDVQTEKLLVIPS